MKKAYYERQANAEKYLMNGYDDGRKGRAFELKVTLDGSAKVRVSAQGKVDVHIRYMNENGKVVYAPAEAKTNGGRIEELLNGSKARFVVYQMENIAVPQSKKAKAENKPIEYRNIPAVVIPKELFLAKLKEFNAIKVINRNGEPDGYGIQVTSKKWYEWLKEYPVIWEQGYTYEGWMFEGLE